MSAFTKPHKATQDQTPAVAIHGVVENSLGETAIESGHKKPAIRIAKAFSQPAKQEDLVVQSEPQAPVAVKKVLYRNEDGAEIILNDCYLEVLGQDGVKANGWFTHLSSGSRVHFVDGLQHKDDGPAELYPEDRGEIWWKHGKIHRNESAGPALNILTPWGDKRIAYYRNGILHSDQNPTETVLLPSGAKWIFFYKEGNLHNQNGAASIFVNDEGHITCERYCINGIEHRLEDDGPAIIDGRYRAWKQEGEFHRLGGPAIIDEKGHETYYLQGMEVDKKVVSAAFLENRNATIGKSKKVVAGPVESKEDKELAMKARIEQWQKSQPKPSPKM